MHPAKKGSLLATAEMDRIKTVLTSLTTMLQPNGKVHKFRFTDNLGLFKEPEILKSVNSCLGGTVRFSSPCLYLYPGCKAYFALVTTNEKQCHIFVAENDHDHISDKNKVSK